MNKKIVIAVLIIAMAMVVYASSIYGSPGNKDSPEVPKIEQTVVSTPVPTEVPALYLAENTNVVAQPKISSDCYGGIGRPENNPPQGTVIDESLTQYYGKTTATGNGETYIYISGWWFNLTQVATLPSESRMYGMSPCAITSGSGDSRNGDSGDGDSGDGDIDPPVPPVPELSTIVLVSAGLIGLFVLYRKNR